MKKIVNIFLAASVLMLVQSCKEEKIVDQVINDVTSGGILRNLTPDSLLNGLNISDGNSAWRILMESQDAANGASLDFVKVSVAFQDNDNTGAPTVGYASKTKLDTSKFIEIARIPRSSFTLDIGKSPVNMVPTIEYSLSLTDLATGINAPGGIAGLSGRDAFVIDFQYVMTDGRVFNAENASANVTRTGFFSYFNAQFRYTATIGGTPRRVDLDEIIISQKAKSTGGVRYLGVSMTDTVFLNFSDNLMTLPTITRTYAGTATTGDVVGDLSRKTEPEKGEYFFLYTSGMDGENDDDTISFHVKNAEVVAGLPMAADSIMNAFVIDTSVPTASIANTSLVTNADTVAKVSVQLKFTEEMGAALLGKTDTLIFHQDDDNKLDTLATDVVTYTITNNGGDAFDDIKVRKAFITGNTIDVVEFSPRRSKTMSFPTSDNLNFRIVVSEIKDIGGNEVTSEVTANPLQ